MANRVPAESDAASRNCPALQDVVADLSRRLNLQLAGLTQFQSVLEAAAGGSSCLQESTTTLYRLLQEEAAGLCDAGAASRSFSEFLERADNAVSAMYAAAAGLSAYSSDYKREASQTVERLQPLIGALSDAVTAQEHLAGLTAQLDELVRSVERVTADTQRAAAAAAREAGLLGENAAGFTVIADEAHKLTLECQTAVANVLPHLTAFSEGVSSAVAALHDARDSAVAAAGLPAGPNQGPTDGGPALARIGRLLAETKGALGTQYELLDWLTKALAELGESVTQASASAQSFAVQTGQVEPQLSVLGELARQLVQIGGATGILIDETAGAKEQPEPVLRMALAGPVQTLDPIAAVDPSSVDVCRQVYARLVEPEGGGYRPSLALSWQTLDAGRTWLFCLRKGARFHDGREITSSDVRRSFERLLDEEAASPLAYLAAPLLNSGSRSHAIGIDTPDPYTVVFRLNHPFQPFLGHLSHVGCSIVPKDATRIDFGASGLPVGSGPYRLTGDCSNERVSLEAFDGYFGGRPFAARLEFLRVTDPAERLARLRDGRLSLVRLTKAQYAELSAAPQPETPVLTAPCPAAFFAGFNLAKPGPWHDIRFRQALNYAIDRRRMVRELLGGLGLPADGPVPAGYLPGLPETPLYSYDPQKASQLLEACGWAPQNREPLEVYAPDSGQALELSEFLAESLVKVGVPAVIRALPWSEAYEPRRLAGCHLYVMAWVAGTADLDSFFFPLFHSAAGQAGNFGAFSSPRIDRMLVEARSLNPALRPAAYREINDVLRTEAPWIFLCHPLHALAGRPEIEGLALDPCGYPCLERVWVGRGAGRKHDER